MEVLNEFKAVIKKGIASLAFSPSGNKLAAIAIDDDHHCCVLDVSTPGKNSVICVEKGPRDVVITLVWASETVLL